MAYLRKAAVWIDSGAEAAEAAEAPKAPVTALLRLTAVPLLNLDSGGRTSPGFGPERAADADADDTAGTEASTWALPSAAPAATRVITGGTVPSLAFTRASTLSRRSSTHRMAASVCRAWSKVNGSTTQSST
jgi:hypothetical protein